MSGTGNSARVAGWIGDTAARQGLHTVVLSSKKSDPQKEIRQNKNDVLGIVFPTHGFTMPWNVFKFVCFLPQRKSARAFCVATRGSLRFGRLVVPGMSGTGTFIIALMLFLKGYRVSGVMSVNMPSNWWSLHPIQHGKSHDIIIGQAERQVHHFAGSIFASKKVWCTRNNLYEIIVGLLLAPVSVGYLFFGRFFLAKLFFANDRCDGCGVCIKNCSFNAIKMLGRANARPFWKYSCESCMRCASFCPKGAIEAGHSWGVLLFYISSISVSAYLISHVDGLHPGSVSAESEWMFRALDLLYFYPALFISYFLFSLLLRIPVVNWFFTHTTLTHIKGWGRYRAPGIKLKVLR